MEIVPELTKPSALTCHGWVPAGTIPVALNVALPSTQCVPSGMLTPPTLALTVTVVGPEVTTVAVTVTVVPDDETLALRLVT